MFAVDQSSTPPPLPTITPTPITLRLRDQSFFSSANRGNYHCSTFQYDLSWHHLILRTPFTYRRLRTAVNTRRCFLNDTGVADAKTRRRSWGSRSRIRSMKREINRQKEFCRFVWNIINEYYYETRFISIRRRKIADSFAKRILPIKIDKIIYFRDLINRNISGTFNTACILLIFM